MVEFWLSLSRQFYRATFYEHLYVVWLHLNSVCSCATPPPRRLYSIWISKSPFLYLMIRFDFVVALGPIFRKRTSFSRFFIIKYNSCGNNTSLFLFFRALRPPPFLQNLSLPWSCPLSDSHVSGNEREEKVETNISAENDFVGWWGERANWLIRNFKICRKRPHSYSMRPRRFPAKTLPLTRKTANDEKQSSWLTLRHYLYTGRATLRFI